MQRSNSASGFTLASTASGAITVNDGQTGESVKLRHVQRAPGHDEHTGDGGKLSKMQPASGHTIGLDATPINMQRSNSASGFTLASTASGAITVNDGQTGESVKLRHVQRAPGHDEHTRNGVKSRLSL